MVYMISIYISMRVTIFFLNGRCVVDYPCHPNVCNLDAHMTREGRGQLWSPGCDRMMKKLTWVTLGYHYNWSTKVGCLYVAHILHN